MIPILKISKSLQPNLQFSILCLALRFDQIDKNEEEKNQDNIWFDYLSIFLLLIKSSPKPTKVQSGFLLGLRKDQCIKKAAKDNFQKKCFKKTKTPQIRSKLGKISICKMSPKSSNVTAKVFVNPAKRKMNVW